LGERRGNRGNQKSQMNWLRRAILFCSLTN
jgi:hypothetical protein